MNNIELNITDDSQVSQLKLQELNTNSIFNQSNDQMQFSHQQMERLNVTINRQQREIDDLKQEVVRKSQQNYEISSKLDHLDREFIKTMDNNCQLKQSNREYQQKVKQMEQKQSGSRNVDSIKVDRQLQDLQDETYKANSKYQRVNELNQDLEQKLISVQDQINQYKRGFQQLKKLMGEYSDPINIEQIVQSIKQMINDNRKRDKRCQQYKVRIDEVQFQMENLDKQLNIEMKKKTDLQQKMLGFEEETQIMKIKNEKQ